MFHFDIEMAKYAVNKLKKAIISVACFICGLCIALIGTCIALALIPFAVVMALRPFELIPAFTYPGLVIDVPTGN